MGRRSSLHEDFVRVKTLMGLEPFEVRFFFGEKCIKFNLALKEVIKNHSKVSTILSMMFLTKAQNDFFFAKSPMGTALD